MKKHSSYDSLSVMTGEVGVSSDHAFFTDLQSNSFVSENDTMYLSSTSFDASRSHSVTVSSRNSMMSSDHIESRNISRTMSIDDTTPNNDKNNDKNNGENNDNYNKEDDYDDDNYEGEEDGNEDDKKFDDVKYGDKNDDNISIDSTESMLEVKDDFHLSELINSNFSPSSVAQPLTPRTRFISACIREGLNPRASLVIRRHMSTHLKLSHFAIGEK